MLRTLRLLLAATIGAVIGLGSAYVALTGPLFDFAPRIGTWQVATVAGLDGGDPYAAARAARAGTVSLGPLEGIALVARTDSDGRPLDPRCHYEVAGPLPAATLWTLAATDVDGRLPENPAGRIGYSSRDALAEADGRVVVVVGPTARPGNFLPVGNLASLVLTLRLYASGLTSSLPAADGLPVVRRVACNGVSA